MGSPEFFERFREASVLVVGDLFLDLFVYGGAERISPEAPVPVLRRGSDMTMLGGAGNVVANIATLGGRAHIVAAVGNDTTAERVRGLLSEVGVEADGLIAAAGRPTATKTRFIAQHQQVLRVDDEIVGPLSAAEDDALLQAVAHALPKCNVVVLSDYAKGVLLGGQAEKIVAMARTGGLPVVTDPRGADWSRYRGSTYITPNRRELDQASGTVARGDAAIVTAAEALIARHDLKGLVVTRSEEGMSVIAADVVEHISAQAREIFDVSGAGDTVVAVLALGVASGLDVRAAAHLANAAAGVVVGKLGTAQVTPDELAAVVAGDASEPTRSGRILDRAQTLAQVRSWRAAGLTVGFTNGCFDILHAGHISLLEQARACCDRLVVAVNSDASVRRLKGDGRPVNTAADREAVLAALRSVDVVTTFDEDTPLELIKTLIPNVLIKGDDYTIDTVVGADVVRAAKGRVILATLVKDKSTSGMIERIHSAKQVDSHALQKA
jgi:D-beta-D-heptose 7-phosphate kinase / D-beta-D-heptose 1-phosphate adenosyltransferase